MKEAKKKYDEIQNAIELFIKKHQKDATLAGIESTTPKKISTPELFNLVSILSLCFKINSLRNTHL